VQYLSITETAAMNKSNDRRTSTLHLRLSGQQYTVDNIDVGGLVSLSARLT